MTELNPIIRAIAEQYKFVIKYDNELEKWIIEEPEDSHLQDTFYWNSEMTLEDFLNGLRVFFIDYGMRKYGG